MPIDQSHDHLDPHADRAGQDRKVEHTMPLGQHLEELRGHIIKMLIGTLICAIATFFFGFQIIEWLSKPLIDAQHILGLPTQTIQTDPTAGFTTVYMTVSLIAAAIVASPWIIWQIWQFVVTGLYDYEKRAVHILAPFSTIMTGLAVMFTYYILLPVSLTFFMNFATLYPEIKVGEPNMITGLVVKPYQSKFDNGLPKDYVFDTVPLNLPVLEFAPEHPQEGDLWILGPSNRVEAHLGGKTRTITQQSNNLINPLPQLGEYVRFAIFMMLGIVIAFQLPVIMLVLGWTQLFDPAEIAKVRKYSIFGCFVAGAILTPTDVLSMFVLAVPLYLLFEFGLVLMRWTYKRSMAKDGAI